MNREEIAKKTAELLLEVDAVKLQPNNPFTWASGWKSPIYCDNRMTLSFPHVRKYVTKQFVELVKNKFPDVECIAGVATAGIPQGALVAAELDIPFVYVRSKAKGHGMTNLIEGKVTLGQNVVVLEDLVSTGGSSLKAAADLKESGFDVLGMVAIFTYGFDIATENFNNAGVKLETLSSYSQLSELALENNVIDQSQLESLKKWRSAPDQWGV